MRGLSLIIALFGVIALLTLGTGGAWASAAAPMSCHEMSADTAADGAPRPSPVPAKAKMVMACCVACVSPSLPATSVPAGSTYTTAIRPALVDLPGGRAPSPEHGPPRPRL